MNPMKLRWDTTTAVLLLAFIASLGLAAWNAAQGRQPLFSQLAQLRTSGEEAMFVVRSREELVGLAAKYGPNHYSRYVEEWIVRDFFADRRNGVFLDVGAHHYKDESNTYYLETALGWSGLAVDALPEFGADYLAFRPRTIFVAMFASDLDGDTVTLFEPDSAKRIASMNEEFTVRKGEQGKARQVPTATLNRLLDAAAIERVDFMSMDIELAEPKALAGFDIERFSPRLVCIEVHPEVRQQILNYFAEHNYVLVGKYLRIDPTNVYFQPLEH
jgi:FkbM family methyltransferase